MWDNKSKVLTGTNTFLFSLNNMKIYDGINGGGIFCHNDLGPWFSHALGADYEFLHKEQNSQCELSMLQKYWNNFENEYELTGGQKNYYIKDIEVFHLEIII